MQYYNFKYKFTHLGVKSVDYVILFKSSIGWESLLEFTD